MTDQITIPRALLEQAMNMIPTATEKNIALKRALRAELAKPSTAHAQHDAPETIALQLELESAKEDYLNACKLVADMHAAAVGEVTGPRLGVVEDVAAIKTERDELLALLIYASSAIKSEYPESQWSEYRVFEMEAAIAKAEGRTE